MSEHVRAAALPPLEALTPPPAAAASRAEFAADVVAGLAATPKRMPPKYFYDRRGSQLFEAITALPEYYPTRTETAIQRAHAAAITATLPDGCALVEFGAGSTAKARILLAASPRIAAYVPVDVSAEFLAGEADALARDRPDLRVLPVVADFTRPFGLPDAIAALPRAGFFPGSTLGNFEPHAAVRFLRHAGRLLGTGASLLVGIDLVKDAGVLHAAYNDAGGVTAAFNLNLLRRINAELGGDFDLDAFSHRAFFDRGHARIEMHLVSRAAQTVRVCGRSFAFRRGETIHTENSYKYTIDSFRRLAVEAGWHHVAVWKDADRYFSVHALVQR